MRSPEGPSDRGVAGEPFRAPASAILCGGPGALLDWVAWAFASTHPGDYFWTDVRMAGQRTDARDPLARDVVPRDHLNVIEPNDLARNDVPANAAISAVVRSDEPAPSTRQLLDFLRLPTHTQELIARQRTGRAPPLLVLSNGQRVAAQYPSEVVGPLVGAIVGAGVSILLVYADEAPQGRQGFENIWHVQGGAASDWGDAVLEVERGTFEPPFDTRSKTPLRRLPRLRPVLAGAAAPT